MRWRFTDKALLFAPWEYIATVKAGSLEEYSLLERWGETGKAPGSLLLESAVQAARWLVEASSSFTHSCVLREINHWRATDGLRPGERFCVFLRVTERSGEHLSLALRQKRVMPGERLPETAFREQPDDTGRADDADGLFSVSLTPLKDWYLPGDRETLWRELRP